MGPVLPAAGAAPGHSPPPSGRTSDPELSEGFTEQFLPGGPAAAAAPLWEKGAGGGSRGACGESGILCTGARRPGRWHQPLWWASAGPSGQPRQEEGLRGPQMCHEGCDGTELWPLPRQCFPEQTCGFGGPLRHLTQAPRIRIAFLSRIGVSGRGFHVLTECGDLNTLSAAGPGVGCWSPASGAHCGRPRPAPAGSEALTPAPISGGNDLWRSPQRCGASTYLSTRVNVRISPGAPSRCIRSASGDGAEAAKANVSQVRMHRMSSRP